MSQGLIQYLMVTNVHSVSEYCVKLNSYSIVSVFFYRSVACPFFEVMSVRHRGREITQIARLQIL